MKSRCRPGLWVWLITSLLLLSGCASVKAPSPATTWKNGKASVTLEYRGRVRSVAVVGDFNEWNPERNPFVQTGDARWFCELHLPPGEYHYLLVIEDDDKIVWRTDSTNSRKIRDAKGRAISLLQVEEAAGSGDDTGGK
ncbi:MAG: hypothetical protein GY835_09815 [bacterium]|nr:hypothetical protein [bacterium]